MNFRRSISFYLIFQFDRVCKLFCEDPATSQSDEFFGVFDYFLGSFNEAKNENENIRRKREEEEKIAKQHQEVIIDTFRSNFLAHYALSSPLHFPREAFQSAPKIHLYCIANVVAYYNTADKVVSDSRVANPGEFICLSPFAATATIDSDSKTKSDRQNLILSIARSLLM